MTISLTPILASVNGEDLVRQLIAVMVIGICALVVWAMGKYFATKLGAPAIALTIWNGLFVLLGGIVIINFLLSLIGHPMIRF